MILLPEHSIGFWVRLTRILFVLSLNNRRSVVTPYVWKERPYFPWTSRVVLVSRLLYCRRWTPELSFPPERSRTGVDAKEMTDTPRWGRLYGFEVKTNLIWVSRPDEMLSTTFNRKKKGYIRPKIFTYRFTAYYYFPGKKYVVWHTFKSVQLTY